MGSSVAATSRGRSRMEPQKPVVNDQRAEVLYFTGAGCATCRHMTPHVQAAADHFGDRVGLVKIDVAADPAQVGAHTVRAVPTLIAVHDGAVVGRAVGALSPEAVSALFAGAADGHVGSLLLSTTERMLRLGAAGGVGLIAILAGQPLLLAPAVGLGIFAFRDRLAFRR